MGFSDLTFADFVPAPSGDSYVACSPYPASLKLPSHASELYEYLHKQKEQVEPVSARDMYLDIFATGLQDRGKYELGKYSGIYINRSNTVDTNGNKHKRNGTRLFFNGCKELFRAIDDFPDSEVYTNGITYVGKRRLQKNVAEMHALIIEIDNVAGVRGLKELVHTWHIPSHDSYGRRYYDTTPVPTYIVCSGNGLHLYYVFEQPIKLYKNVFEDLSRVRKRWIDRMWNANVVRSGTAVQYETLTQAFRAVGSVTKHNNCYALAFRTGPKHTLKGFNELLPEEQQIGQDLYKSTMTLEEAKEKYPNWYQKRIVEGKPKSDKAYYTRNRGIYDNWKQKILDGAVVGHRYFCLENLCSLAVQCEIPEEEVKADCMQMAEWLETLTVDEDNHFTIDDINNALATYYNKELSAYTRKIEYVSERTGIPLKRTKRNGRTREANLRRARMLLKMALEDGEDIPLGRPSKEDVVRKWQEEHPDGRKVDCHRETGLSRVTITKYWKSREDKQ